MSKVYGYIRVSTKDQNEDRQRIAMREFIRQRQAEGIAAAKARGATLGKNPWKNRQLSRKHWKSGGKGISQPEKRPGGWGSPIAPFHGGRRRCCRVALKVHLGNNKKLLRRGSLFGIICPSYMYFWCNQGFPDTGYLCVLWEPLLLFRSKPGFVVSVI